MAEVLVGVVVVAAVVGILAALAWLGVRVRRRGNGGAGGAFVGPLEEMWHPAAHRARAETVVVEQRIASTPTPPPEGT